MNPRSWLLMTILAALLISPLMAEQGHTRMWRDGDQMVYDITGTGENQVGKIDVGGSGVWTVRQAAPQTEGVNLFIVSEELRICAHGQTSSFTYTEYFGQTPDGTILYLGSGNKQISDLSDAKTSYPGVLRAGIFNMTKPEKGQKVSKYHVEVRNGGKYSGHTAYAIKRILPPKSGKTKSEISNECFVPDMGYPVIMNKKVQYNDCIVNLKLSMVSKNF